MTDQGEGDVKALVDWTVAQTDAQTTRRRVVQV